MKLSSSSSSFLAAFRGLNFNPLSSNQNCITFLTPSHSNSISLTSHSNQPLRFVALCAPRSAESSSLVAQMSKQIGSEQVEDEEASQSRWNVEVGKPSFPNPTVANLSLSDKAFFLLAFIACTVFASLA